MPQASGFFNGNIRELRILMFMLKPQDILVTLKLMALAKRGQSWTYPGLARDLVLSQSETHAAVSRALQSGLVGFDPWEKDGDRKPKPRMADIVRFVVGGLKYMLPAEKGAPARGMPTSFAASPLRNHLVVDGAPCPVWPGLPGESEGYTFVPIFRSCASASLVDQDLYELLTLADAIRDKASNPRTQQLASQEFELRCRVAANAAKSLVV